MQFQRTDYLGCLFVWRFSSHSFFPHMEISPLHCRWRAANFDLCSALMAIQQLGSLTYHAYCDTGHSFIIDNSNNKIANKWIHKGIRFIAWILVLSRNEKYIKVSENSIKIFLYAHPPLYTLWRHISSPLHILLPATIYSGSLGTYCRPRA